MRSIARLVLFPLLLFIQTQILAQRTYAVLKGTVIDSATHRPLEGATISIFKKADSSLVNYVMTNKKGEFRARDIPAETPCLLQLSFSGLNTYLLYFTISPGEKEVDLGVIQLGKAYTELEAVIVTAQRPPVIVKNDTIEFNAAAFKTAPDAMLEDLLKKLPGVEVDAQGNITVNGKRVTKITVNGRDFFGSNYKLTSQNLPRDVVDKIQVIDYKTHEARFSKLITANTDKVINLTFKDDTKTGMFGRVSCSYGSGKMYESGANVNYFKGPLQLSFLGKVNNTNRAGFLSAQGTISNPISSFGGAVNGFGENKSAGLNVNNEFGNKLRVNGSYAYENNRFINAINTRRQNILPDTTFFYKGVAHSSTDVDGLPMNLVIDFDADSATQLHANLRFNSGTIVSSNANDAVSLDAKNDTINTAENLFVSRSDNKNVNLELFVGRRLNRKGRALTFLLNFIKDYRKAFETNSGRTVFYKVGGIREIDTLNQQSMAREDNNQLNLTVSFTEPFGKTMGVVVRYGYEQANRQFNKFTYRFNQLTGLYDQVDSLFTNAFGSRYQIHVPGAFWFWNKQRFNANVGTSIQWLRQENASEFVKETPPQYYVNFLPSANIVWRFSNAGNISLNYSGRSQQPSIEQLQPVPDNSNTLFVRLGNPDLKPSFFHNTSVNLQQFGSNASWNANIGWTFISNLVVHETWLDSLQFSRLINSNGNYSITWNMNYSRSWKMKRWSLRVNLENTGNYSKLVTLVDRVKNVTNPYSISQRVSASFMHREVFTVMPYFSIRYNNIRYSIDQMQPTANITQTIAINFFVNWPKRLIWENNLLHNYNSRTAPGFPKGVTKWNMAATYKLLKNSQLLIRVSIFDLLNQNTGINRIISPTFVEDTQAQVLKRYCMASLIFNLKHFGK